MPTRAAPTMHGPAYVFVCACMCVLLLFILLLFIVHSDEHVSHHVLLMHALGHCVCLASAWALARACTYGTLSLSARGPTYL